MRCLAADLHITACAVDLATTARLERHVPQAAQAESVHPSSVEKKSYNLNKSLFLVDNRQMTLTSLGYRGNKNNEVLRLSQLQVYCEENTLYSLQHEI